MLLSSQVFYNSLNWIELCFTFTAFLNGDVVNSTLMSRHLEQSTLGNIYVLHSVSTPSVFSEVRKEHNTKPLASNSWEFHKTHARIENISLVHTAALGTNHIACPTELCNLKIERIHLLNCCNEPFVAHFVYIYS